MTFQSSTQVFSDAIFGGLDDVTTNVPTNLTSKPPGSHYGFSVREYIIVIFTPVLVILGTLGNSLCAAVMLRFRFRFLSTSVYLVALAVCDTTFLYANSMTKNFIKVVFHYNYSTQFPWSCSLYVYLLYTSKCLSAWFIVAVTAERLLVIFLPIKGKLLTTRRRACVSVCVTAIVVGLIYAFIFAAFEVQVEPSGKIGCDMKASFKEMNGDIALKILDLLLYSVLPSVILFASNIVLIRKVFKSGKFRRKASLVRGGMTIDHHSRRLTTTLILVSCAFLIFTLPMSIYLCYEAIASSVLGTAYRHNDIVFRLLYVPQLGNSAVNFILYCISGPTFKGEIRDMMRECATCTCRKKRLKRTGSVSLQKSPTNTLNRRDEIAAFSSSY